MDLKETVSVLAQVRDMASGDTYFAYGLMLLLIFLAVTAITEFCKLLAKGAAAFKSALGTLLDAIRGGSDYKEHLQRRRQFLSVISSDLATIGKAEAWNDQNFTDLEAEVQIDGGYFASVLDRLRKHRSYGQRREKSLIGAIDGSTERCLLLTGDPGAGKSVALRHLAVQMIERARKSRKMYEPIPLYVNLRELSIDGEVDSSQIKKFVIDNVRRGDADTAEYINRNWKDFHENGGWFFLFDSFDEIPAVLHAANEDAQIERFGRAIQQFMDGLGVCRGVLASREFKSPKALAWPRLKILPLNESLQEELVANTFLSKDQKQESLRALSRSKSATYRNPLFLTLLCRYVREHGASPKNEHELLYRHVDSLCERDEEYVVGRWGLTPEMMKAGAAELSRIFAVAPDMGLAPSVEEISSFAEKSVLLRGRVEQVIEALTYVKVGRMDVATASRRERRFAFSHRRYHEAIFAKFLSDNEGVIEASDLLCNPRWREYVVAMLQTSDLNAGHSLIDAASRLVRTRCVAIRLHEERVAGTITRTYAWRDDLLLHLLKLMVDVKTFNPSHAWQATEDVVEQFFAPLWTRGDLFDRLMIIKYGGAGRAEAHSMRLDYARGSGVSSLQEEAVSSCQFATVPSSEVASWIRERVARNIVTSSRSMDALKWEALAAQLPSKYEAGVCVDRAKALRKQHGYARMLIMPFYYFERLALLPGRKRSKEAKSYQKFRFAMLAVNMIPIFAVSGAILPYGKIDAPEYIKAAVGGLMLVCLTNLFITHVRLENIALPRRLSISDAIRSVTMDYKMLLLASLAAVIASGLFLLPGLTFLWAARRLDALIHLRDAEVVLTGSVAIWIAFGALIVAFSYWSDGRAKKRASVMLASRKSLRSAVGDVVAEGSVANVCEVAVTDASVSDADLRRTVTLLSEKLLRRSGSAAAVRPWLRGDLSAGISLLLVEYVRRGALPTSG